MALDLCKKLREVNPLVHCVVSQVSAAFVANCLTAIGARPLVSHAVHEIENFSNKSHATFVNLHTEPGVTTTILNLIQSIGWSHPLVVDPVGAAMSLPRRDAVLKYLSTGAVWILRGNRSEINQLVDFDDESTVGVDSTDASATENGSRLAAKYGCPIWISGEDDHLVSPSGDIKVFAGGNKSMALVSGMGCAVTAMLAAFLGAINDRECTLDLVSDVIKLVNTTAESVGNECGGGTFPVAFLDRLTNY